MEVLVDGVFYIWERQADNLHPVPVCMPSNPLTLDKKRHVTEKKHKENSSPCNVKGENPSV